MWFCGKICDHSEMKTNKQIKPKLCEKLFVHEFRCITKSLPIASVVSKLNGQLQQQWQIYLKMRQTQKTQQVTSLSIFIWICSFTLTLQRWNIIAICFFLFCKWINKTIFNSILSCFCGNTSICKRRKEMAILFKLCVVNVK